MKKIRFVLLPLAIALLLSGCGKDNGADNKNNNLNESTKTVMVKSQTLPGNIASFTEVTSYVGDTDADGIDEKVVLSTSAERNNKGEFLWNDGQKWALYIEENPNEVYVLFDKYVQAGNVYFDVADYYLEEGATPKVLVTVSTGAGLSIKNYSFEKETQAYIEEVIFDTQDVTRGGINKRFSSVPEIID